MKSIILHFNLFNMRGEYKMKLKKSYKVLISICAVLLFAVAATDASLVNSIATIGGGLIEKIYVGPFIF